MFRNGALVLATLVFSLGAGCPPTTPTDSVLTSKEWMQIQADEQGTGFNAVHSSFAVPSLRKWVASASEMAACSPVVSLQGTIWVGTVNRYLIGFNPDGTEAHRRIVDGAVVSTPAVDPDGRVFFLYQHQNTETNALYTYLEVYDPADNSLVRNFNQPLFYSTASPKIWKDYVFVPARNKLYVFHRWTLELVAEDIAYADFSCGTFEPIRNNALLCIGTLFTSAIVGLADCGFSFTPGHLSGLITYPDPSVAIVDNSTIVEDVNHPIILMATDRCLTAFNFAPEVEERDRLHWRWRQEYVPLDCDHIEDSLRATSPAVLDGTQVVIGIEGEVGFVQSYDVSDGTFLWGHRAVAQSPPVAALRHIYVVTPTSLLELDSNGELVSAAPLQGEGGGVSLSLDFVYVMTSEGIHSIPFDPAKPSSFDGLTLDRTHYGYSVPTIAADGTIYFSSPNGFLTAYRNAPLGPFDFPRELPHATWISPQDGQAIGYTAGRPMLVTFTGSLTGEVAISSNVDGLICQVAVDGAGEATCTTSMPMSLGDHVLTVFATDQSGEQLTAQVTVSVINNAPTVHITSPMDQTYLYSTVTNTLTAQVTDADETIPDARIQWKSDVQGALGAGRSLDVTLINGNHTLTCTATDEKGAQTTASVHVTVTVPIP